MKPISLDALRQRRKSDSLKASTPHPNLVERLFADRAWTENYRVTTEERESLAKVALMGEVKSEHDVLFILNQIRRARLRW
jgi:hypothetical protein